MQKLRSRPPIIKNLRKETCIINANVDGLVQYRRNSTALAMALCFLH